MDPSELAKRYDAIADRWLDPDLSSNGIRQHEIALAFRSRGGVALDAGCGCSGRFFRLLQAHGYETEGLDLSTRMIALAKERHPEVTFHQADLCDWVPEKQYDFVTAWDSLWHVPMDRALATLKRLCDVLSPGGILIWTTGGVDAPEEKWDSSMGPTVYYSAPGITESLRTIAEAGCVCRHLEYDQWPEKHVFLIAQRMG
jgi:2-polyprenyl-3-methyl-5-hydroxy-6-metoxy-1,4-benzoquinol methylase